MQFDPRGLVIRPLVVGMGLVHDRRRMRAVAGDGHHRQQYGENGCHYSDLAAQRIVFVFVFLVDFEFGHSGFPYYRGSHALHGRAIYARGARASGTKRRGGAKSRWAPSSSSGARSRVLARTLPLRSPTPRRMPRSWPSGRPPRGAPTTASPAPPYTAPWNPA